MRSSPGIATGLVTLAVPLTALAFTHTAHSDHGANQLQTAAGFETLRAPSVTWTAPKGAQAEWTRFVTSQGGTWRALWDARRGAPKSVMGQGISRPGTSLNAEAAEQAAAALLAEHLDLWAPGASPADFELVSNHFDPQSNLRTVAYEQRYRGLAVQGGQFSVRIKNDRIFVIASEARPHIDAPVVNKPVREDEAVASALTWMKQDAGQVSLRTGPKAAFILPIFAAEGPITYHTVVEVVVDAQQPLGRWSVYLDARNGQPVARRQTLMFANGTVKLNAPERRPTGSRLDWPAPDLAINVNGQNLATDGQGQVTWPGDEAASVRIASTGSEVTVINDAGPAATMEGTLAPGGEVVWDSRDEEFIDAQINGFIHGGIAKSYGKVVAPRMAWLQQARLQVTVNINDECNAFSDGTTINFFRSSRRCENTGRLADVVHHEFGHSFHAHAIVRGAGQFDTALSEGASDYYAATISNDNGMGRGFFYSNAPLRDVDEARDRVWPDDANDEPHQVGLIFGGAMWDLRKNLIAGGQFASEAEAVAYTDQLWYAALQRSSDIPSTYAEVLAADDDDGNIANGTPHICAINEAFARHGLADEDIVGAPVQNPILDGSILTVPVGEAPSDCPGVGITAMNVIWQVRDNPGSQSNVILTSIEGGYSAAIPEQAPGSVVQYRVEVSLDDGNVMRLPDNPADPYYEFFVGETVKLYCTDFESDPELDNWLHALLAGENREGADDWTWGPPLATGDSGDPGQAFSGTNVIGNDLGGGNFNGKYQPDKKNVMYAPTIDTQRYPVVRLQYQRWLTVEDGDFDRGIITSNNREVWSNRATGTGQGNTNHVDKEWRFHDVDLSDTVQNGTVQVSFLIESDGGLEFGGWTIDDFCIVGYLPEGANICGNGAMEGSEVCDDGNDVDGDGCETDCTFTPGIPACGDGTVDPGEACDDGNVANGDGCEATCVVTPSTTPDCSTDPSLCEDPGLTPDPGTLDEGNGGCACSAQEEGASALPSSLALFGLFAVLLTRRRRR